MKRQFRHRPAVLATALVLACTGSAPGWADQAEDAACAAIMTAVAGSGNNVCVSIRDGVATLSGYVDSEIDKVAAERAAADTEGVEEVVSLITVDD